MARDVSRSAAMQQRSPAAGTLQRQASGLEGLEGESFDAVVAGGGILGAGVARELALRGLRCLLVERRDFGWGTTARSTRLIHGGLRYLANYDFELVREGLREREWLLRSAPNLVTPLPFVLPFYGTSRWRRLQLRAGLTLYDLLSPRSSLPRHRVLGPAAVARLEPALRTDGLRGAAVYWDAQVALPERLVLDALRAAEDAGATIRNYVAVRRLETGHHRISGVTLSDTATGAAAQSAVVRTGRLINATGPWADETLAGLGVRRAPLLRLTQGAHLVYPRLADRAVAFEHPADRRLCFAIPWQAQTMVGTTDTDVEGGAGRAAVRPEDVAYLSRAAEFAFPSAHAQAPLWGTVGVRSLVRESGATSSISRRHLLVDHAGDGADGLVTLAGGKLTAWRSIAADAVEELLGERGRRARRAGGVGGEVPVAAPDATPALDLRLWRLYGVRAPEVRAWIDADPSWGERLVPDGDAIRAEVAHAVTREWAVTLGDIVLRRLALGFGPDLGRTAAVAVAQVAREHLGWDAARVVAEMAQLEAENAERRLPL